GLIFVEIAMLFKLEHWVLPVTVLTFAICLLNFREVFAMVEKLLGMVLHRRKKSN
ncbi:MAG TPA: polysaccharide biosynthesis protein, partial [Ruminococcaceae bacterium]|nr:polysaccharide biosynthesis protein [Oscillospiraceae bacterium]